jgi:hypothetical protein
MHPGQSRENASLRTGSGNPRRSFLGGLGALLLGLGAAEAQTQPWNLPYTRPAAYNYTSLYAPTLKTYVDLNPGFFKSELQRAWTYWKANFMMANGLVNHKRLQGNTQIGANEAVSEGQGYGMLLAVLLNDQPTFNKIFEAANANMWDNGRKSYFKWSLPNGKPWRQARSPPSRSPPSVCWWGSRPSGATAPDR